ncbi:MAG: prepilin-type N-terminal cleavage/methylation domain-containing protein [Deltaproteobacteria bacterium]|nr:MAG: prepilin-type N-terminal cleavage/methylation domain-containing protein [Deltaproteobacteria bacterium]
MRRRNREGFTLIEVVVVVAVIAILAAVLTPYITKYIDDSKIAKSRNEAQVIGGALTNFYKDVGQWPNRNPVSGAVTTVLYTGAAIPTSYANFVAGAGAGAGWNGAAGNIDNNLLINGASGNLYPPAGDLRWKGPYISVALPLDPWGRPYLLNVATTGPLWVISAGPDQRINTRNIDNVVAGDDIGFRVR